MAYVVPNSTIYLLSEVPLTPDQRDTYYFENEAQQQSYFRSKIAFTFTAQSYQRVNRGRLRIQLNPAQNVYQCNYLMFTNTSHWNNKWFYAFILKVDYINENCAEITYKIDVLQTWFFNYVEEQCMVKRQSPNVDSVGSNLQPEGFDCGEYVCNNSWRPQSWDTGESYQGDYIGLLYLNNFEDNDGGLIDNVFSAAQLWVFHANNSGVSKLNDFIDGHISEEIDGVTSYYPNNIIGIYMMPHECFAQGVEPGNGVHISTPKSNSSWTYEIPGIGTGSTLDGYTPKYQKLYTSPFSFISVDMGNGQGTTYRYEMFNDPVDIRFSFEANSVPPCALTIYPQSYKHNPADDFYHAEQISTGEYPLCSWSTDYWSAYLGQTSTMPLTEHHYQDGGYLNPGVNQAEALMNIVPTIEGLYKNTIKEAGKIASGAQGVFDSVTTNRKGTLNKNITDGLLMTNPAYRMSDIVRGTVYNGNNWYGHNRRKHVTFRRMSVTAEYAEKIDHYFDAFGYAVNAVQQPLRRTRTRYTYVQTQGCEVRGAITGEVKSEISEIYDNGIRFWNYSQTGDTLGTYTINLNNGI